MLEAFETKYRDRRGGTSGVRYLRAGSGPAVVLIHGVGMRAEVWDGQMEALSARYEVLAIDMPGHGGSSAPPDDVELADYVEAVCAVLDERSIAKARVIGHSMGALVALECAITHPERFVAVVAMNAVFCRTDAQRAAIEARLDALDQPEDVAWEQTIERWFGGRPTVSQRPHAERLLEFLENTDRTGYERTYRLFARSDAVHKDRLATLACPALFMTGEFDPNSTADMSLAMSRLAPRGEGRVLAGERHMMAVTSPREINRLLLEFLCRVDGAKDGASIDPKALRKALGSFATGVTVVTTVDGNGTPRGFTANSFTSVSLDPPLVLVGIAKTAASRPVFTGAEHFAVNILSHEQVEVSNLFATKSADKFARSHWKPGTWGSPVLDGVAATFECRRYDVSDAGDHVLLIGQVLAFDHSPRTPLAYCRGAYVDLALDVDPIAKAGGRTRIGALVEWDGALLLEKLGPTTLDLPWGATLGGDATRSLEGRLDREGANASMTFVFAIYHDGAREAANTCVVYRGTLRSRPAPSDLFILVPLDRIPFEQIRDPSTVAMIERYVEERRADLFGVYVGDANQGVVEPLARTA